MRANVRSPRRLPLLLAALGVAGLGATQLPQAFASTPSQQTITLPSSPGTNVVNFVGHAPVNNGQANLLFDDQTGACDGSTTALRDEHTVIVKVPTKPNPAYDVLLRFEIDWNAASEPTEDMRLDLFGPDGKLVASSDSSQFQESINLSDAIPGKYSMHICAFQTGPTGQNITGLVRASVIRPAATPLAGSSVKAPTYKQFEAPKGVSTDAGEPSIGNNWKTDHTFFTSNTHEYDVKFNDTAGTSTWTGVNVKPPNGSNLTSLDPIGFTDSVTGRSFVSQLLFVCSGAVFTDNDFQSVTPSQGCGSGINGFDHQTFGGGPYPKGMSSLNGYPHAVYYCSQAQALVLGNATCARSDTGGLTFGTLVPVWNGACTGLHGHVRVAPNDGTVYLPDGNCHGQVGIGVSTNAGNAWTIRKVPGSLNAESDPSVSAGSDGTLYLGYADGTGRPEVAVSRDRGATWNVSNIGTAINVRNTEFAEVIAGDGDRAAFAFLGTPTKGSTQADTFGKSSDGKTYTGAEWHMYVTTTYDRGAHWTTVDATPTDPVQRGCIWNAGGSNPCRNLLDFNDITVDKIGRVMVGFADGCVSHSLEPQPASSSNATTNDCVASTSVAKNGQVQHGAIIRQQSGKGLFKKYDGVLPGSGGTGSQTPVVDHPSAGGGSLATTGATPYLAGFALLLLLSGGGVAFWRRRHSHA
jgi:hypothetical protein